MGRPARFKRGHQSRVVPNAGRFASGHLTWNKGKPYLRMLGNTYGRLLKGRPGRIPTDKTRRKLSESHKGKPSAMRGRHHSDETKAKLSAANSGPKSATWNGGESVNSRGYVTVTIPKEEAARYPTSWRYSIRRSHLVWNRAHPDDLVQFGQVIHHLNHERADDRVENLMKFTSNSEHIRAQH